MNNATNVIKNTLEGTNSRIREAEGRINEVEDRMVEINKTESKKEKWIKRNEVNLRDRSPRGSPVPRILQARTLEWVVISFSNA